MVPAYNKDEKVLCFHHELLYEAKILGSRPVDSSDKRSPLEYLVHYKGWKNTYALTSLLSLVLCFYFFCILGYTYNCFFVLNGSSL